MLCHLLRSLKQMVAASTILLIVSSLLSIPSARAQSAAGSISGDVFDQSGTPLADAKVTVVNINSGTTRAVRTDQNGHYQIAFLPPGVYSVTVSLSGYIEGGYPDVRIQLNRMNPVVPPLTLNRAVVTAPSPRPTPPAPSGQSAADREIELLVTISDATRRGNFSERQIEALPLGGSSDMRSFDDYALLLPGVSPPPYTPNIRGPGIGFGIGTAGQFSVNGARARSNNFTIDGSDNNDPDVGVRRQGFVALLPQSIESIREFQVSTLLWDAEQGRNLGSLVNAVSKEGSNAFHGQAFGFFTDSSLNARNFFDYSGGPSEGESAFTRVQTGFIVTGPITKKSTQFFGSFEHINVEANTEQHFATVPPASQRRFLGLPRFGVLGPAGPFLFNEFFAVDLGDTPVGRRVLSLFPEPNNAGGPYGANTFTAVLPVDGDGSVFSYKVTHQFSETNVLNVRYNFTDDDKMLPSVNRAMRSTIDAGTRTQNLSLIYDTQFGAKTFNQARFSYGRTRLDLSDPLKLATLSASATETVNVFGQDRTFDSQTGLLGEIDIEPFSPLGINASIFPQNRVSNTFQYADSLSWTLGRHSVKFGGDIRRVQLNSLLDRNYRPQVVYGGAVLKSGTLEVTRDSANPLKFTHETTQLLSGLQLAELGLPSSIFQTVAGGTPNSTIGLRFTEYNFFLNDNWRVRSNFVLDYGLRYEYNTVPRDASSRIESALKLENLPKPGDSLADTAQRTTRFNEAVEAYRQFLDGRSSIYQPDRNNFGPHIGFAWDPWSDHKTSVRAGYGIYHDAILGALVSQSRNVFPNEIPVNVEPNFIGFDVFNLNAPSFLEIKDGQRGDFSPPIFLIKPDTLNQFGGAPKDFVALIGALFLQNANGGGLAFTLPEKNLRTPYAQQWHVTLEREVMRDYVISAAYVGTKGTKLTRLTTPNGGPNVTPSIALATSFVFPVGTPPDFPLVLADCKLQKPEGRCSINQARRNSALGAYQVFENSASSNYHALQLEARKRYSRGYQFTLAYTWSHALDDVSDVFPIAGAPVIAQDSLNLRTERGNASFDIRHLFSTSLIWDLPLYRDKTGGTARLLGGWQVASIFQAHSGQPFTLTLPVDANLDGNLTDRPSTTEGLMFFDQHGARKVAIATGHDVADFFVLGQNGFVGRNTVRADGFINWDLALSKRFALTDRQKLDFRAEFFNATNRANFGIPIHTLGSPAFGSAVETANPARIIQFALKYSF